MKAAALRKKALSAMTLVETMVAMGVGTIVLAGFTAVSIGLQKSFIAIEDYAKGQNDQMRISDYLSLDMRRAFSIAISGDAAHPPLTVTMIIPNFYASANTPNDPHITGVTGWPYKKHHHNHHQNIVLNQVVDYSPVVGGVYSNQTTLTVVYSFDQGTQTLSRTVNGASSIIARDVKDFSVAVSDLDETAQTQITFQPRFNNPSSAAAVAGTTYYQTTNTRNTR
jgi:hypothetical protein